jgi:hypothetical protein
VILSKRVGRKRVGSARSRVDVRWRSFARVGVG